jgi:hypothetical protein
MERGRRNRITWICWDDKHCQLHPSSVLGGAAGKDLTGHEFGVFFDRMRVDTQLYLFDVTSISRVALMLTARKACVLDRDGIEKVREEAAAEDDADRYQSWTEPQRSAGDLITDDPMQSVAVQVEDGFKTYSMSPREAALLVRMHDVLQFFTSLAAREVDVTVVPDALPRALADALGYPLPDPAARQAQARNVEAAAAAAATAATAAVSAMSRRVEMSSSSESDDDSSDGEVLEMVFLDEVGAEALSADLGDLNILTELRRFGAGGAPVREKKPKKAKRAKTTAVVGADGRTVEVEVFDMTGVGADSSVDSSDDE